MTRKVKSAFVFAVALVGLIGTGCSSTQESPTPAAPPAAAPPAGGAAVGQAKPAGQMDTGVEAAPAGVKTDLSGGLK